MTARTIAFSKTESPKNVNASKGWTAESALAWAAGEEHRVAGLRETETAWRLELRDDVDGEVLPAGATLEQREDRVADVERRTYSPEEIRVVDGPKGPRIVGRGIVFNRISEPMFGFREKIAPGAADKALRDNPDIVALFNHDPNRVLGRTTARTLDLTVDKRGVAYEIRPPEGEAALVETIRRGDVTGSSFGFVAAGDKWERVDGVHIRTITQIKRIFDIGPVTLPAYKDTTADVALRSLERWETERRGRPDLSKRFAELMVREARLLPND